MQSTAAVKGIVAEFEARSGNRYSIAVSGGDQEKPFNVLGYVYSETLTRAIR